MSRTEFHTGKLYPINFGKDLEGYCRRIAKENDIELNDFDWKEDFRDKFDEYERKKGKVKDEYFIQGENLYRVIDHVESDNEEYFMKLTNNDDGSISFMGQFYNGGTCFSEMLEEALDEFETE
jgi:hypothetical protein